MLDAIGKIWENWSYVKRSYRTQDLDDNNDKYIDRVGWNFGGDVSVFMASLVWSYLQTQQVSYINYVQLYICQSYLHTVVLKK